MSERFTAQEMAMLANPSCIGSHQPWVGELDLVNVVRCRNCAKWSFFDYDIEDGTRIGYCSEWSHLDGFSHATNENGFCSWGERRDA